MPLLYLVQFFHFGIGDLFGGLLNEEDHANGGKQQTLKEVTDGKKK